MDTVLIVAELQAEARCPICLDYLSDPVTIKCGHNFCHSCISRCWEGFQQVFPCPICFYRCPGQLKINTQLRQLVSIIENLPTSESNRRPLCEEHGETLDVFCKEDRKLLCPQCRVSSAHHHHDLIPVREAAMLHRRRLKVCMQDLQDQIVEAEIQCEVQVLKFLKLRLKIRNWKKELTTEFEELKRLLERGQDAVLAGLHLKEKAIEEKLKENRSYLSTHVGIARDMLSAIKEQCLQGDIDLLRTAPSLIGRYEGLQAPEASSYELRRESSHLPPQYFCLQKMSSMFQVDMTLDPQDVPLDVVISEDRKSMKLERKADASPSPRPSYITVQSSQTFRSGRYFWQVEVRGTGKWCLGVCPESTCLKGFTSPDAISDSWHIKLSVEEQEVGVSRVGVFLDFELGEVSFFDLDNRSCLRVFTDTFTEKLVPFFSIECSSQSLSISIVREE